MNFRLLLCSLGLALVSADVLSIDSGDISSLSFSWTNSDQDSTATAQGPNDGSIVTDSNVNTGEEMVNPAGSTIWGSDAGTTTVGMAGKFYADSLVVPAGKEYWSIETLQIVFSYSSAACFSTASEAEATYVDYETQTTTIIGDAKLSLDTSNKRATFKADISGNVFTKGPIGFTVSANTYCTESEISIMEFVIEGVLVDTAAPSPAPTTAEPTEKPTTADPTKKPTTPPTTPNPTKNPTSSPVSTCTGGQALGDPHLRLFSGHGCTNNWWGGGWYHYQGRGWHYYTFPCDIERDYKNWPFFLLSYHIPWTKNPKATLVGNNALVINTKNANGNPDPWIIYFHGYNIQVNPGYDVKGYKANNFDLTNLAKDYSQTKPKIIEYNDGDQQSGEIRIYPHNGLGYIEIWKLAFHDYPRDCNAGFGNECGKYFCADSGMALQVSNAGHNTMIACPDCFKNLMCGMLGKYIRGDCSCDEQRDQNDGCYSVLQSPDKTVWAPIDNNKFWKMAETWQKDKVEAVVTKLTGINPNIELAGIYQKDHAGMRPRELDDGELMGECADDDEKIAHFTTECRANTIDKYEKCCKELGAEFCEEMMELCVFDMCACMTPPEEGEEAKSESECLDQVVHASMNATCSNDALWPTDAPTSAPTFAPSAAPTHLSDLEKASEAAQSYWYVIMVIIIVGVVAFIAAGLYFSMKAKNRKMRAYFGDVPEEEEAGDLRTVN